MGRACGQEHVRLPGATMSTATNIMAGADEDFGSEFCDQFIGSRVLQMPYRMLTTRKKARIVSHWAQKIGAVVSGGG